MNFTNNLGQHPAYILGMLSSKRLKDFFNLPEIFIETGTCKGDGVDWALTNFNEIVSTEIYESLFLYSKDKFKNNDNVIIENLDTLDFLNKKVPELNKSTFFYLDAHASDNNCGSHPNHPVPFVQESEIILNNFYDLNEMIVAIDDERCWSEQMKNDVINLYKKYNMSDIYLDDTIIFCNKKWLFVKFYHQ
jgi:hypothetical protein